MEWLWLLLLIPAAILAVYFTSPNRRFLRTDHRKNKAPLYRPVKRYKSKLRGIGVGKRVTYLGAVTGPDGGLEARFLGVDRKNYVRFYPNFGFTIAGRHWCRKGKHDGTVR